MDARTGYTHRMTERGAQAQGGAHVRAFAYVRVSSEERRHGYSLDDQEREELCIQIGLKGWELEEARNAEEEAERLRELPPLAQGLARDLPYLLEKTSLIREYETDTRRGR